MDELYCQICRSGYAFLSKEAYERHARENVNHRRLICLICSNSQFNSEEAYRVHCRDCHPPTPYSCEKCSDCFQCVKDLIAHFSWAHLNVLCGYCRKPYDLSQELEHKTICACAPRCTLCNIVFPTSRDLDAHDLASHPDLRCVTCNQQFKSAATLEQHFKESTGIQHPSCTLCTVGPLDDKRLLQHYLFAHIPSTRTCRVDVENAAVPSQRILPRIAGQTDHPLTDYRIHLPDPHEIQPPRHNPSAELSNREKTFGTANVSEPKLYGPPTHLQELWRHAIEPLRLRHQSVPIVEQRSKACNSLDPRALSPHCGRSTHSRLETRSRRPTSIGSESSSTSPIIVGTEPSRSPTPIVRIEPSSSPSLIVHCPSTFFNRSTESTVCRTPSPIVLSPDSIVTRSPSPVVVGTSLSDRQSCSSESQCGDASPVKFNICPPASRQYLGVANKGWNELCFTPTAPPYTSHRAPSLCCGVDHGDLYLESTSGNVAQTSTDTTASSPVIPPAAAAKFENSAALASHRRPKCYNPFLVDQEFDRDCNSSNLHSSPLRGRSPQCCGGRCGSCSSNSAFIREDSSCSPCSAKSIYHSPSPPSISSAPSCSNLDSRIASIESQSGTFPSLKRSSSPPVTWSPRGTMGFTWPQPCVTRPRSPSSICDSADAMPEALTGGSTSVQPLSTIIESPTATLGGSTEQCTALPRSPISSIVPSSNGIRCSVRVPNVDRRTQMQSSVPGDRHEPRSRDEATPLEHPVIPDDQDIESPPVVMQPLHTRALNNKNSLYRDARSIPVGVGGGQSTTPIVGPSWHCRVCARATCDKPTATMCGHIFCRSCIVQEIAERLRCPVCENAMLVSIDVMK